jgi:hypothetical protein
MVVSMNRQEIIQMAKKAGLDLDGENIFSPKSDPQVDVHIADLEVFAVLVASAEREACARVCNAADKSTHPADLAEAIRARGQA